MPYIAFCGIWDHAFAFPDKEVGSVSLTPGAEDTYMEQIFHFRATVSDSYNRSWMTWWSAIRRQKSSHISERLLLKMQSSLCTNFLSSEQWHKMSPFIASAEHRFNHCCLAIAALPWKWSNKKAEGGAMVVRMQWDSNRLASTSDEVDSVREKVEEVKESRWGGKDTNTSHGVLWQW